MDCPRAQMNVGYFLLRKWAQWKICESTILNLNDLLDVWIWLDENYYILDYGDQVQVDGRPLDTNAFYDS